MMLILSRHLHILLNLLLLIVLSNNSLSFVVHNSIDGHWRFREGSNITFVCTIKPYTGVLSFIYNLSSVYECTGSYCTITENNKEEFTFEENIVNGEFTWTVSPVKMSHNGKQFQCSDGLNVNNITAVVEGSQHVQHSGAKKWSRQRGWALFTFVVIFQTSQIRALSWF